MKGVCITILFIFAGNLVNAQLIADFSNNLNYGCPPLLLTLNDVSTSNNKIVTYNWNIKGPSFQFTSSSNLKQITVPLENPGLYDIRLIVCDSVSNCDTVTKSGVVEVYSYPEPILDFNPDSACAPYTFCFENVSIANCGSPGNCIVDMGDGTVYNSSNTNGNCKICHIYDMPGTYNVTLLQTNSCGCSSDTTYISAVNISKKPLTDFEAIPQTSCHAPQLVQFSDLSSNPGKYYYEYYINDSLFSISKNASIKLVSGVYDVSFIVYDSLGCSDTAVKNDYIKINNNSVSFSLNGNVFCEGDTVALYPQFTSNPDSLIWHIDGPENLVLKMTYPQFVLSAAGSYSISCYGYFQECIDTAIMQNAFEILSFQKTKIKLSDSVSCSLPFTVQFSSSILYTDMKWEFPGGSPQQFTGITPPPVTYYSYGSFPFLLKVTDSNGCTHSFSDSDAVSVEILEASIISDKSGGCVPQTINFAPLLNLNDSISFINWDFNEDGLSDDSSIYPSFTYTDTGCFSVNLIVETVAGCRDTVTSANIVCLGDSGMVKISASPVQLCYKDGENCINISGHSDSVWIGFGDGFSYEGQPSSGICHLYEEIGLFNPVILAFNKECLIDTSFLPFGFEILGPKAHFRDSTNCSTEVFFFNESIEYDSLYWDFGEFAGGDNSSKENPVWTYSTDGIFLVSLTAFDSSGLCINTFEKTITVKDATALFHADSTYGCAPFTTVFHNISSGLSPNSLTWWDFDGIKNGLKLSGGWQSVNKSNTFQKVGYHDIAMRFRVGNCDDTLLLEDYIRVYGTEVVINADTLSGCVPFKVSFNSDSCINIFSKIESLSWFFGDGDTSALNKPVHTYKEPGVYPVILQVVDSFGCRNSDTLKYIRVKQPYTDFIISDSILCSGQNTSIIDLSDPDALFHVWYFNDSLVSNSSGNFSLPNVLSEGLHSVKLVVLDSAMCSDTLIKDLIVSNPNADFSLDTSFATCPPLIVNFSDQSFSYINKWAWDFGNGAGSTVQNPAAIYTQVGSYEVELIVTSVSGCADTLRKKAVFIDGPDASMTIDALNISCPCIDYSLKIESYNTISASFLPGNGSVYNFSPQIIGTPSDPAVDTLYFSLCDTGLYFPRLSLNDQSGCNTVIKANDTLKIDTPVSRFLYSIIDFCDSGKVCFYDLSTVIADGHSIKAWYWDFGNGVTDSLANPCVTFHNAGVYPVSLKVVNEVGCISVFRDTIIIFSSPTAKFSLSDSLACAPVTISSHLTYLSNDIDDLEWWIGDTALVIQDWNLYFPSGNDLHITLIVSNSQGCTDTVKRELKVLPLPVISLPADTIICRGDTLDLEVSGGVTGKWKADPFIVDSTFAKISVSPITDQYFTAIVIDSNGCSATDSVFVEVSLITADFDFNNSCISASTSFIDHSISDESIDYWNWSFGDNTFSNLQHPLHQYGMEDIFNIILSVENIYHCRDSMSKKIQTIKSDFASFRISAYDTCFGEPICFYSESITTSNCSWDVNNDGIADYTADSFCHVYQTPGSHKVVLFLSDTNGCSDSAIEKIQIADYPELEVVANDVCLGEKTVLISNVISMNSPVSYSWNVSDQYFNDEESFDIYLPDPGYFQYSLTVANEEGCSTTLSDSLYVESPVQLIIFPKDTVICKGERVWIKAEGARNFIWSSQSSIGEIEGSSILVQPDFTEIYKVTGQNSVCPPGSENAKVKIIPIFPFDILDVPDFISLGQSLQLSTEIPVRPASISWQPVGNVSCTGCFEPVVSPVKSTMYYATAIWVRDGVECSQTDSVMINVSFECSDEQVFIPNAFSPDDDNINDIFYVRGVGIDWVENFMIFDRWGKLIYQNTDFEPNRKDEGWNGKSTNNEKLNTAVFVYYAEVRCVSGDIIRRRGNVQLIR